MEENSIQNQEITHEQNPQISPTMAKNSLFRKEVYQDRGVRPVSFVFKFLNRLSAVFLFAFIIFLWCSSTIIISGSIVHVCLRSRKLNSPHCLSVGTPSTKHELSESFFNGSSGFQRNTSIRNSTQQLSIIPPVNASVLVQKNNTLKTPEIALNRSSVLAVKTQVFSNDSTGVEESTNVTVQDNTQNAPEILLNSSSILTVKTLVFSNDSTGVEGSINLTIQDNTHKTPEILLNSSSSAAVNTQVSDKKEGEIVTQDSAVSSLLNNSSSADVETQIVAKKEVESVTQESAVSSPTNTSTQEIDDEFTTLVLWKGIDKAKAEEKVNSRKAVESLVALIRSYTSTMKPSNCEGRGIYVYDLPPKFNKDLVAKCNETMTWMDFCKFFSNDAMGDPIQNLGKGWYNTHQFSLEPIFHKRILRHPCRVENPEEAKLFYVPFYGALDMIRCHFNKNESAINDAGLLSNELVEWLEQQKMWQRNFGLDHVFVLGKISWDFRRVDSAPWGSPLLELVELQNPIKLLIERQPWKINEIGVPYPTYFHPSSDEEIISWQKKIRRVKRRNLISFAGAPHDKWENIRSILIKQCTSSPKACNFLDCGGETCVESSPVINLFAESEFCLQPPGDSPTRKSMFDSLLVGCIPVVFDPFTAHYQYPWHFPVDHKKYSVYIDQDAVQMSEVNVIEKLVNITKKERQKMREYIIDELMPRLVYADGDAKLEKFEDAITIAVNNLLQMVVTRLP